MNKARTKLLIAGVVISVAVTLLAVAGVREGWVYYLPVDQFVSQETHRDQRVRLHGTVGQKDYEVRSTMLSAKFDLQGETRSIRVNYTGVIPDLFEPGREVVVEGRLDDAGVFEADTLMTKCASKYGSEDGQAPHDDPRNEREVQETAG